MSQITVDFDPTNDEVVIIISFGTHEVAHRLRPLDGWLLLYLLAPDVIGAESEVEAHCKNALANEPPVGLTQQGDSFLLSLPSGQVLLPANKTHEFRDALGTQLRKHSDLIWF